MRAALYSAAALAVKCVQRVAVVARMLAVETAAEAVSCEQRYHVPM